MVQYHLFSRLKKFFPIIGIFLFIYTIYILDIGKIIEAFLSIEPVFLLIALPLTIPHILIRNKAWLLIQKEQNIHIPFWASLKIFLIGYFYGSITPAYVGQLMRIPYMKEQTNEPYGKLFINSFLETTLHTLSLYGMIFIGALLVLGSFPHLLYLIIAWFIILTVIIAFFIDRKRGEKAFHFLVRHLSPSRLKPYFTQFFDTFYHDFPTVRSLFLPGFIAMFTWIIVFSQEYLIYFFFIGEAEFVLYNNFYILSETFLFLIISFKVSSYS